MRKSLHEPDRDPKKPQIHRIHRLMIFFPWLVVFAVLLTAIWTIIELLWSKA